jgi:hypothetical protein
MVGDSVPASCDWIGASPDSGRILSADRGDFTASRYGVAIASMARMPTRHELAAIRMDE